MVLEDAALWVSTVVGALAVITAAWRAVVVLRKQVRDSFDDAQAKVVESLATLEHRMESLGDDLGAVIALTQVFFQSSPHAMYWTNADGVTARCNQAYLDFFGYKTMAQARTDDWLNHVRHRPAAESRLRAIVSQPQDFDFPNIDLKDGRSMRVIGHKVMLHGEFAGYVGYVFDEHGGDISKQVADLQQELLIHAAREEEALTNLQTRLSSHLDWEEAGRPTDGVESDHD